MIEFENVAFTATKDGELVIICKHDGELVVNTLSKIETKMLYDSILEHVHVTLEIGELKLSRC